MRKHSLTIILLALLSTQLLAHPHYSMEAKIEIEFNNNIPEGVWIEWEFDDYFSQEIINYALKDGNATITSDENQYLYDNYFINLKNYNFFVYIRNRTETLKITSVKNFTANINKKNKLVYKFFIPLEHTMNKKFSIAIFDPTFYMAINYVDHNAVKITGNNNASYTMNENKDNPIYYDPFGDPSESIIYSEWKPGFNTHYPVEVYLEY